MSHEQPIKFEVLLRKLVKGLLGFSINDLEEILLKAYNIKGA